LGDLRGHVALVTQEHHVFVGTLRENLVLARPGASDDEVHAALEAVDAQEWVSSLPAGLDTIIGSGGRAVTAAHAQQIALARPVLADPHTLVLDEATSLIDPRAARHLERSLAAVLEGRTVIAIAHRLFSAHDADRVAVVEIGVISEFGSHDDLVAAGWFVCRSVGLLAREGLTAEPENFAPGSGQVVRGCPAGAPSGTLGAATDLGRADRLLPPRGGVPSRPC
jgi:ABC-type multidrug transport system fused ATPase/permease subunit